MARIPPLPIVGSVVVCEAILALAGSEVEYQAEHHQLSNSGTVGLLLRSIGAPLAPPWHQPQSSYWGEGTAWGVLFYLAFLAGAVWVIAAGARPERPAGVVFLSTWCASTLSLIAGEFVRILIIGDQLRLGSGNTLTDALSYAPTFAYHGVYFGWVPAAIAAIVARWTPRLAN